MVRHEVTHADRAHVAVGEQLFQCAVRVERETEPARQWLMKQQEVEAIDTEFGRALLERVQRGLVSVVADPHLRLEKDLRTRDTRSSKPFTDLSLVEVGCGSVDETIPMTDR